MKLQKELVLLISVVVFCITLIVCSSIFGNALIEAGRQQGSEIGTGIREGLRNMPVR